MEPDGQRRLLSSTTWHISPGELIAEACLTLSALLALALLVLWDPELSYVYWASCCPLQTSARTTGSASIIHCSGRGKRKGGL